MRVPGGTQLLPRHVNGQRTRAVMILLIMICVASAAWWVWRLISRELAAVYAEGFREAGLPER